MKKWTKILCCVLLVGLFSICTLTGCATVGNITNKNKNIIYNGNIASMVDGYLYYGNGFADISGFSGDGDYKSSVSVSHLSRVNTNADLAAKSKDFAPKVVENVSDEVVGYSNSFMFVLGQQIFYATPNRQKVSNNGETSNEYNYTCIYRSNLNGDKKKKLYTTTATISQIEALKIDGTYYIVMLAGENLVKINLSNSKAETVAEGVKSVALPKTFQENIVGSTLDWNGYVYFTKAAENNSGQAGVVVNRVKLSGGEEEQIYHGTEVSLIGREEDVVFFTEKKENRETETFLTVLDESKSSFDNQRAALQTSSSLSDFRLIASKTTDGVRKLGYVYTVDSQLGFAQIDQQGKPVAGKNGIVTFKNNEDSLSSYKILFVTGRTAYISTTTGIYRADLQAVFNGTSKTVQVETIVTMKAIYDGTLYAFDGEFIYFYAQLEDVEVEDDEEEPETDANYYLYRAAVGGTGKYQLLGLPNISSRRS